MYEKYTFYLNKRENSSKVNMIRFVLPTKELKNDVISFYNEFVKINSSCIGISNYQNYEEWL